MLSPYQVAGHFEHCDILSGKKKLDLSKLSDWRKVEMNLFTSPASLEVASKVVVRNDNWIAELKKDKVEEWLVDCYRLRSAFDKSYRGDHLHGIYLVFYELMDLLKDLLVFSKLAVKNNVIDSEKWNWKAFLKKAAKLITIEFDFHDALVKYGVQNYNRGILGGRYRCLTFTADMVYGFSTPDFASKSEVRKSFDHFAKHIMEHKNLFGKLEGINFFEDVGGKDAWIRFYQLLQVNMKPE